MWQGLGEWLQQHRPGAGKAEQETWLGWDGWVSLAGPTRHPGAKRGNGNER